LHTRFITKYDQDFQLLKHRGEFFSYGILLSALLGAGPLLSDFYLGELANIFIYAVAGMGLMILAGFTGLISLGHAAFLGIGAYSHTLLLARGFPLFLSLILATLMAGLFGTLLSFATKNMRSIYFSMATMAFALLLEEVFGHWKSLLGGFQGLRVPPASVLGLSLDSPQGFYYLCLGVTLGALLILANIMRTPLGRSFLAIRDSEISALSLGINVARGKMLAMTLSAAFTGLAGALLAHRLSFLTPDAFNILLSIELLLAVVIGGLGSIHGAFLGAIFVGFLPQLLAISKEVLPSFVANAPGLEPGLFGLLLILVIMVEPFGIYGRWKKIKFYLETFPLYRKGTFFVQRSYLKTERLK